MKEYHCAICNKPFLKYPSLVNTSTPVCSKQCKSELFSIKFKGENNSNYGKKWTEDRKKQQSILVKSKVNDEYRFKTGTANRGKKFSKERIEKMHGHRPPESYSHPHTDETKRLIGKKSKLKFTEEYKTKQRRLNEEKGYWVPLAEKDSFIFYRDCANWVEKMFDLFENNTLLKEKGVFNSKTNKTGVVRDHIYSRKSGFISGVFPEILRHPCNCQLLTHSENVKKKKSRYTDADGKTIEELFNDILNYKKEWKEQEKCVQLIEQYKNGLRYSKQAYIEKYNEYNN